MTQQKARIAVVGTGWWSTSAHIPGLKANPNAELIALCDKRADVLDKAAEQFRVPKTYTDLGEMLAQEKLDGAVVCVNHAAHYEVAKACLEAGLPIVIDKPMVLFAREAHELMNLASAKGVELIMGYPWHYTDNTRRARDILLSGELGAIQYVSCLFSSMVIEFLRGNDTAYQPASGYAVTGPGSVYANPKLSGGGQGHLQVTHSAGSLFFITGLQADTVTAFMENFDVAVDVADAIAVRFKPVGSYPAVGVLGSTGNISMGDTGQLEVQVFCEKGRLALEQIQSTLYVRAPDRGEQRYGPLPEDDRYLRFAPANNLVDVILGKGKNESPAEVGVRVVELLDAAYRSSADGGRPVRIAELLV
jgi:predicted dehydrogenase